MNNKFKCIVSLIIILTMCFSSIQVFAVKDIGNVGLKDNKNKTEEITIDTSMGTFHIRELTDESIKQDMLNKIMEYKKPKSSSEISPFYIPNPGDGATILYGPYQDYSNNRLTKTIIKASCNLAMIAVPIKLASLGIKTAYQVISIYS